MPFLRSLLAAAAILCFLAPSARAADPGKATGTITIDGTTTTLTLAASSTAENLFDSKKSDTMITLTDRPLGDAQAGDDVSLSMRARKGDLVVVMLRIDGARLVNVSLMYKGLSGVVKLPGQWFTYAATGKNAGTLKLVKNENNGHTYASDLAFNAAPAAAAKKTEDAPAPAKAKADTPLPPSSTSSLSPKAAMDLFVAAMMQKDEHQAMALVKSGVDPNLKDKDGLAMLNWAVITCLPTVVQALVDRKASLTYQRVPGFTILLEAGVCPEAAKILKAAGAK
jgi:hypothetical protein